MSDNIQDIENKKEIVITEAMIEAKSHLESLFITSLDITFLSASSLADEVIEVISQYQI